MGSDPDGVEMELCRQSLFPRPGNTRRGRVESVDGDAKALNQVQLPCDVVADAERVDGALRSQSVGADRPYAGSSASAVGGNSALTGKLMSSETVSPPKKFDSAETHAFHPC